MQRARTGRLRIPRWAAPIYLVGGTLGVHVLLPWAISLLTRRNGWSRGRPSLWNYLGVVPVACGLGMIAWAGSVHILSAPQGWQLQRTPEYMLRSGPYRFSRNPMYVCELAMWLGWATFYGSVALLAASVAWWITFVFAIVPDEERQLEARFGQSYVEYKRSVPRWLRPAGRN